jgi:TniQ
VRNDHMLRGKDVTPLPRRVAPRPWEDIASFLSRTALVMGYPDPRLLLHPQEVPRYRIKETDIAYLSRKDDYLILERLLLLDEEALYQMTLHRFASVLLLAEQRFEENPSCIDRPLLDRRPRVSRSPYIHICPLCLSEAGGYDRVYWRIPSLMSCPEHHVILRMHCPECRQPIRALRRDAYRCPSCHTGDYRRGAISFLSDKHPLFQEELLLVKALGLPSAALPDLPVELAFSPVLHLKPADYWYLFRQTASFLRHFHHELRLELGAMLHLFPYQEILADYADCQTQAIAITFFHAVFADWPQQFFTFLDYLFRLSLSSEYYLRVAEAYGAFMEQETTRRRFPWLFLTYQDYVDYFERARRGVLEREIEEHRQQKIREAWRLMGAYYDEQLKGTLDKMRIRASSSSAATYESE